MTNITYVIINRALTPRRQRCEFRVINERRCFALILSLIAFISPRAFADLISYPNVYGTCVTYTDIQEDPTRLAVPTSSESPPTFGQPTGSDSLGFPNLAFKAASAGGGFDLGDSKLSMTISALNGVATPCIVQVVSCPGISDVTLTEFGDYSLTRSASTSDPTAEAKAIGWVTVEAIDGQPISPFVVIPSLSGAQFDNLFQLTGSQNSSLATPWSGTLVFNVAQALKDKGYTGCATELSFSLDDTLEAMSDASSASLIEKKGVIITTDPVPEPSLLLLVASGTVALGMWRRKRLLKT